MSTPWMTLLFVLLVLSVVTIAGVAIAGYLRVKRLRKKPGQRGPETAFIQARIEEKDSGGR